MPLNSNFFERTTFFERITFFERKKFVVERVVVQKKTNYGGTCSGSFKEMKTLSVFKNKPKTTLKNDLKSLEQT